MRLPKNILSGTCKPPKVFLCQVDKTILGGLNPINFNGTFKFNSYHEISFELDRTYIEYTTGEYKVNPLYKFVTAPRLIYVVGFGYFEIQQSGIVSDGLREYKEVVAYSSEIILSTKYLDLFTINMGTVESIDGVRFYSAADPSKSLMHLILEKTDGAWVPGHIDLNLQDLQRSFEVDHESIYDFCMNTVSDTFKCVFEFDTTNNTVNAYDEENYGKETNIFINKDNLAQEVHIDYNGDEIKTSLYVYGDSDIDIREVNLGMPNILDLSYFHSVDWMGQDLYDTYEAYCKLAASKQEEYAKLMEDWSKKYDELSDVYNKVPDYDDNYDDSIPTVHSKAELPLPSESNVYKVWRVVEGDATWYYICKAELINGKTSYRWVLDVDHISSFYDFPEPSVEYADLVVKVYNQESTKGVLYYICKVIEAPSQSNNWTTRYGWLLAENQYGLKLLKEKEQCYLDIQEVHVSSGFAEKDNENYPRYLENYNKLIEIQEQIKKEEVKTTELQAELDNITSQMSAITDMLKIEKNFTREQIIKLNSFIREDEYNDSNFVITDLDDEKSAQKVKKELMEAAKKELRKISQPQLSFSMDMSNILAIPAFEPILHDFEVGNCVTVEIRPDYVVKTQILEVQINFDDMSDFHVTFGNLTSLYSQIDIHAALMSQAVQAGKSVAQSGKYWTKGADQSNSINKRIEKGLIDINTSIKSSENQAIEWDSHGFKLKQYANEEKTEYNDEQIWMNNNKIVFTDDNWKTAKMAVGKISDEKNGLGELYGIIAPNIVGTLLAGENLVIDSAKTDGTLSSFRVDANGARLYNSTFLIEKTDSTGDSHAILIDPDTGIVAGDNIYETTSDGTIKSKLTYSPGEVMPDNTNFYLDVNTGNAMFRGTIYAENGYFSGDLAGADITGATGTFSGILNAHEGDIGGWKIKSGVLYSDTSSNGKKFVGLSSKYDANDYSTDYAIWAGATNPSSAPFSVKRDGTIKATNGVFSGTLNAANGTFAGDISAATGTFQHSINVNSQFIVDEYGNVNMNGSINLNGNINLSNASVISWGNNFPGLTEDEIIDIIDENQVELPNYIHRTYISSTEIVSPTIRGNNMEVYGSYKVLSANDNTMGYMGAAIGQDASGNLTEGVAMSSGCSSYSYTWNNGSETTNMFIEYANQGNYIIATNGGTRMQSGSNQVVVTSSSVELNFNGGIHSIRLDSRGCLYKNNGGSYQSIGSGGGGTAVFG